MKKIDEVINKTLERGKLPKGLSLYDFQELQRINNTLDSKDKTSTINKNIADRIIKLYPKKIKVEGIGWVIG